MVGTGQGQHSRDSLKAILQRRNPASLSQTAANKHAPIGGLTGGCAIFNLDQRLASAIPPAIDGSVS